MNTSQKQPKHKPEGKSKTLALPLHPCDIQNDAYQKLVEYRKANTSTELFEIQCQIKVANQKTEEYIEVLESALRQKIEYAYTETSKHSIT